MWRLAATDGVSLSELQLDECNMQGHDNWDLGTWDSQLPPHR